MDGENLPLDRRASPCIARLSRRDLLVALGATVIAAVGLGPLACADDRPEVSADARLLIHPGQNPRLQARREEAGTLLVWWQEPLGSFSAYRLNATAEALWLRCDGRSTVAEIIDDFSHRHGLTPKVCRRSLELMLSRGLLLPVKRSPAAHTQDEPLERRLYRVPRAS